MKKVTVSLIFFLFAGTVLAQTQLWVSPSGSGYAFSEKNPGSLEGNSLHYKIITLRNNGEHNIQVILKEGVYALNTPVVVSNAMAGSFTDTLSFIGVATDPDKNSGKAVVSGGKKVTGWQDAGNGIYKAQLPSGIDFRQLYVNGKMAIRARHPNRDSDTNYGPYWKIKYFYNNDNTKMLINESEIQQWSDMNNVEMVIHQDWVHTMTKVNSFEKRGVYAIVSIQSGLPGIGWGTADLLYFWENSFDFLDAEGEWYFNKTDRFLYYKPYANEDINQVEIIYPDIDRLFTIKGDDTTPVQNVYLQNIEFKYSNWAQPNVLGARFNQGAIPMEGDIFVETMLHISHADNMHIVNCNIIGAGGNGIDYDTKVKNSEITACHFDQIAANAILIDDNKMMRPEALLCTDNRIAHNLIENFGMIYANASSLFAGSVARLKVEHNEICYSQFSGLQIGNANPFEDLHDNLIRANNVHHTCRTYHDGSGLYTTASMPGTFITRNFIHDLERVPWFPDLQRGAIFLDDHSAWITVEDNVLLTEGKVGEQDAAGADRNAHDNIIRNNDSQDPEIIAEAGPQIPTGVVMQTEHASRDYYYVYPANEPVFKIECKLVDSVKVEEATPTLLNFYKEDDVFYTLDIAKVDSIKFSDDLPEIQVYAYPYGIPHAPGVVEAEDFDYGGEGVAYHDTDGINIGDRSYRTDPGDQGVDIQKGANYYSNGFCVAGIMAGEWLTYTIHVPEAGEYAFSFWTLNDHNASFDLVIDGAEPAGQIAVPNSSWGVVKVTGPNVQLSEGTHRVTLRLKGSFGLDKFEFLKSN
jgi:hypothetical protein